MTARDDGWTASRPGVPDEPGRREDDGGPAFPVVSAEDVLHGGMTLRDWFAGQALAGMVAEVVADLGYPAPKVIANHAYDIANAMLAARSAR